MFEVDDLLDSECVVGGEDEVRDDDGGYVFAFRSNVETSGSDELVFSEFLLDFRRMYK